MKTTILCLSVVFTTVFSIFIVEFNLSNELPVDQYSKESFNKVFDKRTRADLAAAQNFEMTKDPALGYVPRERLWKAIDDLKKQQYIRGKAAINNVTWTERGPSNVGGRTRTMLFDPKDNTHSRVFSAGVGGGLFVTDNIYAATPTWTPVDDFLDNMAITSIAVNPIDQDTMYFGTGEGYFNADAIKGDGVFMSVDAGDNWTQLANTTNVDFDYVQKVVSLGNGVVLAACRSYSFSNRGGIMRSTDGGTTWTKVLPANTPYRAADMEVAANGDLYCTIGIGSSNSSDDGIWKSTNEGASWIKVYNASSSQRRIEIACAPSNSNYIYGIAEVSGSVDVMIKSTDAGITWDTMSNITWYDQCSGGGSSDFTRGQAWYDLLISVDENDENTVVVGGIDLFKTSNAGSTWSKISSWVGCGGDPEVHADQHVWVFAPGSSDTAIIGNDGGIYLTEDASAAQPSFAHQVNSYNTTQFYACAIHPTAMSNHFLAGAQDNGSQKFSATGVGATTEVSGGDGAFCHIDQDAPSYQFTSYVYSYLFRSTNGGSSFSMITMSTAGRFINPTDYDDDADVMYGASGSGSFWRMTSAHSSTTQSNISAAWSGQVSAITCDPNTSNRVYFGTGNGELYKVDNANGSASYTSIKGGSMPSGYVSCIAIEDGDADHLMVTYSNYGVASVWESLDGGSSWNPIEGNLPDIPVRWAVFSPISSDQALLATELGVWSTDDLNNGSTVWAATNDGLANVRVDMLQLRASDSTVIAATHGRGLFSYTFSAVEDANFSVDKTMAYECETLQFTDGSVGATSWAWDFDNDGITDATTQNPTWSYGTGGDKTISLTINGSNTETKTDYVTVLPKVGVPYYAADGGNFENNTWHFASVSAYGTNLWERGAPSNAISTLNSTSNGWKTDLDADCPDETIKCYLYTPSFNLDASGSYTLSFQKSMESVFSSTPYAVYMEYSINSGGSWSKLGTYNDPNGTNWYNKNTIDASVISDQIGWLGTFNNQYTDLDISSLSGNSDVRFRFVFESNSAWSGTGFVDGFMVDDFEITGTDNDPDIAVETSLNASATADLGPNETVYFYSNNCNLIAKIENLSSHDYGSTTVEIDNAGTGTMDFDINSASSKQIMEKTILITPTVNNGSGNVKITTYYSATEGSNWKSTTGWSYAHMNQIKSPGAISAATIANTIHGTSPVIDSAYAGNNIAITCTYSNGFSGIGAGKDGSGGPLPVELIRFDGKRIPGRVDLFWTTASEINSDYFQVERLQEGVYVPVTRVTAAGNSHNILNYTAMDNDAQAMLEPVLYYRLKIVDYDGSSRVSRVIALNTAGPALMGVYPNPAKDFIEFRFDPKTALTVDLSFYDISGNLIKRIEGVENLSRISIEDLPVGMYFLQVFRYDNSAIETKRIIIVR